MVAKETGPQSETAPYPAFLSPSMSPNMQKEFHREVATYSSTINIGETTMQ
jgi:hypothetical protein